MSDSQKRPVEQATAAPGEVRYLKFDEIFLHMSGVDIEDDEAADMIDDALDSEPTSFASWGQNPGGER